MRTYYYIICFIVRGFIQLIGGYKIVHPERLKNWTNAIVVSNHISYFDPPFIGSLLPKEIHYLAKSELFENPLLGRILRSFNALPVRRGNVDRTTIKVISKLLQTNRSILIFPEGSRKSFTAKPGIGLIAHNTGAPILPVYIENTNRFWDCLLRKRKITLYIGEMIDTSYYSQLPPEKNTYRKIAEDVLSSINGIPDESKS